MAVSNILRSLRTSNPWWSSGQVPLGRVPPHRREPFQRLRELVQAKEVIAITGPRQMGKTTMIYQLISDLLGRGVPPTRILFFSFDYPGTSISEKGLITSVIEEHREGVLGLAWEQVTSPVYVFLDEVTRIPDWDRELKGWYDRGTEARWIISDSSQVEVAQGIARSLVGRAIPLRVLPMNFLEAVPLIDPTQIPRASVGRTLAQILPEAVASGSPDAIWEMAQGARRRNLSQGERLRLAFRRYLIRGGQPAMQTLPTEEEVASRLREYFNLVLSRDLLPYAEVRSQMGLEAVAVLLAEHTAQRVEISNLSKPAGLSLDAVRQYLGYLERLQMVSSSASWAPSRSARMRRPRKFYYLDHGLANALSGRLTMDLWQSPEIIGKVVETAVHRFVVGLSRPLGSLPFETFYWRDSQGREVDMLLPVARRLVPIEVKFQQTDSPSDSSPTREFLQEKEAPGFGILLTKDTLAREGTLLKIPVETFLSMG